VVPCPICVSTPTENWQSPIGVELGDQRLAWRGSFVLVPCTIAKPTWPQAVTAARRMSHRSHTLLLRTQDLGSGGSLEPGR